MYGKQEVDYVNKQLQSLYGCELDGRPKFRVVWSEGLTEVRVGTHRVFSPSGVWLRDEYGARECRKYNYIKDMFILERLLYYRNPEVLRTEMGSYEPVWVFRGPKGEALDPILPACKVIIDSLFRVEKTTVKDVLREDQAAKKSEFQYNLDVIQNNSPYLATMLHNKEAVFHDSTKEMTNEVHSGEPSSLPTEGS